MQVRIFCSVDYRPVGNTSQADRCTYKLVVSRSTLNHKESLEARWSAWGHKAGSRLGVLVTNGGLKYKIESQRCRKAGSCLRCTRKSEVQIH